jgi:hypothetical protein
MKKLNEELFYETPIDIKKNILMQDDYTVFLL